MDLLKFLLFGPDDPYLQQAWIGAAIGAATSVIGGIFGASKARKAQKKQEAELKRQKLQEQADYLRRYNEDYTQTATAQSLLNKARQYAEDSYKRAAGAAKVGGASTESEALAKQAGNKMVADVAGNIAEQADARRDNIEAQHQTAQQNFANQQMQMYGMQAQQAQQAGSSVMQAGMGLVGMDLQSHLQTGKGMFSTLFKSKS